MMLMRLAILISLLVPLALAAPEDTPATFLINDYADFLSEEEVQTIAAPLKALYDAGTIQYSVVIINSLGDYDIATYAYLVAEGNLGDEVTNNGLLLLIALEEQQYRFETGRGLEATLPDLLLHQIGEQYLVPNFAKGEYAQGLLETNLAIQAIIEQDTESDYYATVPQSSWVNIFARHPYLIFFLIAFVFSLFRRRGRRDDDLMSALILGSMFSRGGGNIGGFGGFGGGSFGGGGSGGSW